MEFSVFSSNQLSLPPAAHSGKTAPLKDEDVGMAVWMTWHCSCCHRLPSCWTCLLPLSSLSPHTRTVSRWLTGSSAPQINQSDI
ncbi:hypothetical protein GBAR_LOCUS31586 [Geodia barretti]|uniref:Uncharacterized protein n=1 Tax=Geodia barretti TaxID=519541 RepID=A0AA35U0U9_GEOBA|nr:hypothetical protein GBAR_LOCUS31586 [Geodia barretti]